MIELSKKMNFKIGHVSYEDSYGIWNESSSEWTGVVGINKNNKRIIVSNFF